MPGAGEGVAVVAERTLVICRRRILPSPDFEGVPLQFVDVVEGIAHVVVCHNDSSLSRYLLTLSSHLVLIGRLPSRSKVITAPRSLSLWMAPAIGVNTHFSGKK
jgi:hypothetical protein